VARYDTIGHGYSQTRREDPRFRAQIHAALGNARTVVNVGAGTGAYEPSDRHAIAIEPSDVMAAQRSRDLGDVRIDTVPIPCDTPDWMLGSFWAHPERVRNANARAATSGFARMPTNVVDRVVSEVSRDLASGRWDDRHGHLRTLDAFDAGLRLVVAASS
jgi:hypothetical protein